MISLWVFVLGLVWGSFLNVVIYRTVKGEDSPLSGRSKCDECKKQLAWYHNIPLLSFIFLRGKCAYCKKEISWHYPLVELISGLLFLWWYLVGRTIFLLTGMPWGWIQPLFWLVVGMCLLVVGISDLLYGVIPEVINLGLFSLALVYRLGLVGAGWMQVRDLVISLLVSVGVFGFFYFLWWVTKEKGFGFGDVKFGLGMGLLLGWPRIVVGLFIAFVVGSIVGVGLILFRKKKFGQTIPFGPFLVLGVIVALWWGQSIWQWYWGLL